MCVGGSAPKAPDIPPPLPEAPQTPTLPSGAAPGDTGGADRRRRRAAAGETGTILTGPRGIQDGVASGPKTLLGQ